MTTETDIQATYEKWLGSRADDPTLPHDLIRDAFLAGIEAERQTRGQPAVGEEIHVHIEGLDVLTLPLASSGIGAPRFVVHVPAQPDVSLTPDVQTDRQDRMPSDAEILACLRPLYSNDVAAAMGAEDDLRTARLLLSRYGSGQPADDRAAYESGRRVGLDFAHSVVSEILRKHYYGGGINGLNKLVQQAADVIAREKDNPTTATTDYGQPAASAIPVPTTKEEYIALLDLAIELGKKLNIAWEDAFRATKGQPAASAEPDNMPPLDDRATYPASMIRRLIREDRARRAPVAQEPVARDWPSIRSAIDEYLDGYELIGEPGDHTPTEFEKFLLADAIAGLLDDEKFLGLFAAPVAAQVQPTGYEEAGSFIWDGDEWRMAAAKYGEDPDVVTLYKRVNAQDEPQQSGISGELPSAQDREDAERYRWATALDDNSETLHSIVLSYGGDQAKINERVDVYRACDARAAKGADHG